MGIEHTNVHGRHARHRECTAGPSTVVTLLIDGLPFAEGQVCLCDIFDWYGYGRNERQQVQCQVGSRSCRSGARCPVAPSGVRLSGLVYLGSSSLVRNIRVSLKPADDYQKWWSAVERRKAAIPLRAWLSQQCKTLSLTARSRTMNLL